MITEMWMDGSQTVTENLKFYRSINMGQLVRTMLESGVKLGVYRVVPVTLVKAETEKFPILKLSIVDVVAHLPIVYIPPQFMNNL